MADKKTTLFELHMHGDAQFGPSIMGGSGKEEAETTMESDESTEMDESSGSSRIPRVVMAVVALAVISFAVRKIRSMRSDSDGGAPIEVEKEDVKASA